MASGRLRQGWNRWQRIAQRVGRIQAAITFSLLYFLLAAPVALLYKLLADPLQVKRPQASSWHPIKPDADAAAAARRQS
jgi:hypothetical protein